MVIRLATPQDLDAVFDLAVAMRQETHWKDVPFEPDREETIFSLIVLLTTSTNHVLYVAEENDRVMGFCLGMLTMNPFVPQVPFVAELGWYVEPAFRATKAGMALWRAVKDWGQRLGAKAAIYGKPILGRSNGKPHHTQLTVWQTLR